MGPFGKHHNCPDLLKNPLKQKVNPSTNKGRLWSYQEEEP